MAKKPGKRREPKGRTFIVPYEIYPFDVMVSTESYKRVVRRVKRRGYKLSDLDRDYLRRQGEARTVMLASGATVIQLRRAPIDADSISTVVHEIVHAVDYLFRKIDIPLSESTAEVYAYTIGYLTQRVLAKFSKEVA